MQDIELIHKMIAGAHDQADDTLKDTNVEQFNWTPPGTANPVSAVFVHYLTSEDFFIQTVIQGKPWLWETGGWGEKTGVKNTPGYGGNWDEFKHSTLAMEPVFAYQQVVRAATDSYLSTLTSQELGRKVKFADGESTVTDVLILMVFHIACHAGEISALRGIQGGKGLPY
jgi:hypothetical protein